MVVELHILQTEYLRNVVQVNQFPQLREKVAAAHHDLRLGVRVNERRDELRKNKNKKSRGENKKAPIGSAL